MPDVTYTYVFVQPDDGLRHVAVVAGPNGAKGTSTLCGEKVDGLAVTGQRPWREIHEGCLKSVHHTSVITGRYEQ